MSTSPVIIFSGSAVVADQVKAVLEANGIPAWLQDAIAYRLVRHLAVVGAYQSTKVTVSPMDVERAQQVLEASFSEQAHSSWECPECNESIEGQFAQCWNCGSVRPANDESTGDESI